MNDLRYLFFFLVNLHTEFLSLSTIGRKYFYFHKQERHMHSSGTNTVLNLQPIFIYGYEMIASGGYTFTKHPTIKNIKYSFAAKYCVKIVTA